MAKLSETLTERGYVYQLSSQKLSEITEKQRTIYLGIDPSADSLQIGQLMAFLILRRFVEDKHKVVILVGGGTGMIGDPGGKSVERPLLDTDTVRRNSEALAEQVKRLLGGADFMLLDNAEWLASLNMIEFLRDVGKHFTVNTMLQRDFIKERIKNLGEGISYTEFSYALLQAYDFLHLHREHGVDVQVGGSDQWGNIVSGVDYVRRKTGDTVYAFTWPLLVDKKTGKKFGKSETGVVWLDPNKTTPFQFYQFLFNTDDDVVGEYLLKLTMLSTDEVNAVIELHKRNPKEKKAQQILAREVTTLVHGEGEALNAEGVSQVLFGDAELSSLSKDSLETLRANAPSHEIAVGTNITDALVAAKLSSSKREARQFLEDNAVDLNGTVITDPKRELGGDDFYNGIALLKRGKRNITVLTLA